MCGTDDRAEVPPAEALPVSLEWKGEVLALEPETERAQDFVDVLTV